MSWLYSRALVAEYSAVHSSDGQPSAQSKSTPMPQAYLSNDRMTAFSRFSRYGMTFAPSTEIHGEELLTSFREASLAKISARPEKEQESPGNVQGFGKSLRGSLARYDRDTSSWRTRQYSLLGELILFSETWPRWGTMRNGECSERSTPELPTKEIECGLWPTPVGQPGRNRREPDGRRGIGLETAAKYPTPSASMVTIQDMEQARYAGNDPRRPKYRSAWPTPTCHDGTQVDPPSHWDGRRSTPCLGVLVNEEAGTRGGQLNPTWVEWLMGWPLGWTDLKPLETDKFQQWLRSHGRY